MLLIAQYKILSNNLLDKFNNVYNVQIFTNVREI